MNEKFNLSFKIICPDIDHFIDHWSSKYSYSDEYKYDNNVGKQLTEISLIELFEWKNGSIISKRKQKSIQENYPLSFSGDESWRYLNHKNSGGAIWNIFYLHCLSPSKWPIYDQHTHRAMKYIKYGLISEISITNKQKYESYKKEYIPFIRSFGQVDHRKLDKSLFAFGQFLKIAQKYA